jgi:hypothetical protein
MRELLRGKRVKEDPASGKRALEVEIYRQD